MNVIIRRSGAETADGGADGEVVRLESVVEALLERNRQLEHALQSRVVIEQAKGMLAERLSLEPDEAFELIRRAARSNRITIRALAHEVLTTRQTPDVIFGQRASAAS